MFNLGQKKRQTKTHLSIDGIHQSKKSYSNNKNKKNIVLFLVSLFIILLGIIIWAGGDIIFLTRLLRSGKHLVLFQNNAELRPTGGFIGSFAEVTSNNFWLEDVDFESNIYKRDNQFTRQETIIPRDQVLAEFIPEDGLALRDSNWSPDFSQAASDIAWFYRQEGGSDLNTLIALNSDFFKDLLDIIGPIDMVKYNLQVDSKNFNEVLQQQIEETYYQSKENESVSEPKSILAEMMPIVLVRAKKIKNIFPIYRLIISSLKNKNIILYSFNQDQEKNIKDKNWGGSIHQTNNDYLYINHANLGANKSSIYINEEIKYNLKDVNSNLTAELNINRFYPENKYNEENINFTRVYVPKDSSLLKAYGNGKDILDEVQVSLDSGKTVFRLWTNVSAGQSTNVKLIYKLPENMGLDNYNLTLQKQPGAVNQTFEFSIDDEVKYYNEFSHDMVLQR